MGGSTYRDPEEPVILSPAEMLERDLARGTRLEVDRQVGGVIPAPVSTRVTVVDLPSIPAGNPYLGDSFHMGQAVGKNLEMMFANHDSQPCGYVIFVNKLTGERVRVDLSKFAPQDSI